jgi:hypothetical protein
MVKYPLRVYTNALFLILPLVKISYVILLEEQNAIAWVAIRCTDGTVSKRWLIINYIHTY